MPAVRPLALAIVLLVPSAAAEFGAESPDGYPLGADGRPLRPPVDPVQVPCDTPACQAVADGYLGLPPVNKVGPLTVYPYYPLLTAEVRRLADEHPGLVKLTSAGKSTAGLDIWMLEIANFADLEAGTAVPLEAREVVYLDGGTHSNEYSGVYFNTEVAQFLLDEYETNETARWIVDHRHTFIVPLVNPDGSNVFGRLNAKTVNINRNFPATWGAVDETSTPVGALVNNPGPEGGSEVETQAVLRVIDEIQPDYVNSIHCCALLFLHPWGAEEIPSAPDLKMLTRVCDEVFAGELRDRCGPIWSTIYPASGTTADEGYARAGASSWTYEMHGHAISDETWGEPVVQGAARDREHEAWSGVMHALLNVEKYGAHPVVVSVAGDAASLSITVENDGYGDLAAGNVTVAGRTVPLPPIAAGERATVAVEGSFAPGDLTARIDYVKRAMLQPKGSSVLDVPLVAEGDRLVGVLEGASLGLSASPGAEVPAAGALALAAALAGAAALRRRRA